MPDVLERYVPGWANRNRHTLLLVALLLHMLLLPVLAEVAAQRRGLAVVASLTFTLMVVFAILGVGRSKRELVGVSALAVGGLSTSWFYAAAPSTVVLGLRGVFTVAFLGCVTVLLLRHVLQQRRVTYEVISAALCAYVTLGLAWASVYALVELGQPGSFHVPADGLGGFNEVGISEYGAATRRVYYSFVTLLTLGYGDIYPVTAVGRIAAVIETLLGQVLLVVLIARLVGINVAQAAEGGEEA